MKNPTIKTDKEIEQDSKDLFPLISERFFVKSQYDFTQGYITGAIQMKEQLKRDFVLIKRR